MKSLLVPIVIGLFSLYQYMLLASILLSWMPVARPNHPAVRFIDEFTEPVLKPLRRVIPTVAGIDFSPMLAFILLQVARRVVITFLVSLGL